MKTESALELVDRATDICTALSLTYAVEKYLGRSTFRINGPAGQRNVTHTKYRKVYWFFHLCVLTLLGYMVIQNDVSVTGGNKPTVGWYIHTIQIHSDFLLVLVLILCNGVYSEQLTKIWTKTIAIDEKIRSFGIKLDNCRIKHNSVAWLVVNTIFVIDVFISVNIKSGFVFKYQWGHWVYLICNIYRNLLALSFRQWVFTFKCIYEELGGTISNLRIERRQRLDVSKFSGAKIKQAARIHQELSNLRRGFNDVHSIVILAYVTYDFVQILSGVYLYSTILTVGYKMSVVFGCISAFGIIIFIVTEIATIWMCDQVAVHANSIKKELLKLTSAVNNAELQKEINAFALQLLHDDAKITAGGFFDIDLPLIFTMVGAGSTYLIILIQFDLAAGTL